MADLNRTAIPIVGVVAAIAAFISPFEGERLKAYPDPADPAIATICMGETRDVNFGDVATHEECQARLFARIPDYLGPIDKMLPDLPDNRRIAYTDAAWNLGVGILTRRSTKCVSWQEGKCDRRVDVPGTSIVDLERASKPADACARLLAFDHAGGRSWPGLVKRRRAEFDVCMKGLT